MYCLNRSKCLVKAVTMGLSHFLDNRTAYIVSQCAGAKKDLQVEIVLRAMG